MMMDAVAPATVSANNPSLIAVPGQVIAVQSSGGGGGHSNELESSLFLRGHGTLLEASATTTTDGAEKEERLSATVVGTVVRVNKLVSVDAATDSVYRGHVGDLVVGRVLAVTATRWKVELASAPGNSMAASLPLAGVYLPGGLQRMRTAQDAREMRHFLAVGDLVSAEVHKILPSDQTLQLHTRSVRYGPLQNGCLVVVPPGRITRRKNHYITDFMNQFQILLGCNGYIWIQRQEERQQDQQSSTFTASGEDSSAVKLAPLGGPDLVEWQEAQKKRHVNTPYTKQEREDLARLRNALECLRITPHIPITIEAIQHVYERSVQLQLRPFEMLRLDSVTALTERLLRR